MLAVKIAVWAGFAAAMIGFLLGPRWLWWAGQTIVFWAFAAWTWADGAWYMTLIAAAGAVAAWAGVWRGDRW